MRTVTATALLAMLLPAAAQAQSLSSVCEQYKTYYSMLSSPVPPTTIMGIKTQVNKMVGNVCDQPSQGQQSDIATVLRATNIIAVNVSPYQGMQRTQGH